MNNISIYTASIYLADNEGIENLTGISIIDLKQKILRTLKDYVGEWYPELFEKIQNAKSIEYIIDEDDEHLTRQINRIAKHISKEEQIKINIVEINPVFENGKIVNFQQEVTPLN